MFLKHHACHTPQLWEGCHAHWASMISCLQYALQMWCWCQEKVILATNFLQRPMKRHVNSQPSACVKFPPHAIIKFWPIAHAKVWPLEGAVLLNLVYVFGILFWLLVSLFLCSLFSPTSNWIFFFFIYFIYYYFYIVEQYFRHKNCEITNMELYNNKINNSLCKI